MKTSCFARASRLPGAVAISRGVRGNVPCYEPLAPPWALIRLAQMDRKAGRPGWQDDYARKYEEQVLERLDVEQVIADLSALAAPHEPILLCHEPAGEFCHRRIVADWLSVRGGRDVPELTKAEADALAGRGEQLGLGL